MTDAMSRNEIIETLKSVDSMLYSYNRDHRVSGHKSDNTCTQKWVDRCTTTVNSIGDFLDKIHDEASKNHMTGE